MEATDKKHIKNYIEGIYTQGDAEKVLEYLKSGEQDSELDDYLWLVWNQHESTTSDKKKDLHILKKEAYQLLREEKRKYITIPRKYILRTIAAVASVILLISLTIGGYKFWHTLSIKKQLYTEQTTTFGEKRFLILPDGTKITLNSCSSISYPDRFEGKERRVILDGEAFFEVAKNDEKPFIINTNKFDVKVLGTEFNVKAYNSDVKQSVNVHSGKVQVDLQEATLRLTSDEQVDINTVTKDYTKFKGKKAIASWRVGNLQFNRTPIKDIANELERVYDVKVTFEKGQQFDNLITGEHYNADLKSVLQALSLTSNIQYTLDERQKTILFYK